MIAKAINTDKYYEKVQIDEHLKNVEYIIMAAPAPKHFSDTPIHFTIFLNTDDNLPSEIQNAVFEKFLKDYSIKNPKEIMSKIMPVGFSMSNQDTAMPLLLVQPQDQNSIPHSAMFVMDFLADSDRFVEAKEHKLTGWSYKYNS